ncbi:MAG: topoisomerase I, DNA topoisomerase I protein [Candidatus Peregrinibacteria bacterium GW2011_GWC2_39_14]|nr:MAG: topoisomerase protein [Candidatus Peregrinibacteria bacterium GW2011_GWA2_38_36]KKR05907.1 MAG: topoisomerase I, DNA topoisomerase I protein [Candidatus Peregrinibacteria bacterium GW2011_GWC2_39_14]
MRDLTNLAVSDNNETRMGKNLVIVESPTKAKTISRFLDKDYTVIASMGHVRDLPKSKMSIDVEHNFEPTYTIPVDKKKTIKQIKDYMKEAKVLWIATDEDREGEAIGWHLIQALDVKPGKTPIKRIVFHEITEKAILDAIKNPREIDTHLVDAQQARRVLDRLVGYELSPLLWTKVRYGLSAGRVQSVAVRLVVEKEREILAFKPEEFWNIIGQFATLRKHLFEASLTHKNDKEIKIKNEAESKEILGELEGADYKITSVEERDSVRTPPPPFTTSTLQQEASRKLGYPVKKTMVVAQQLYEGVEVLGKTMGLITYMRTDSVNLAASATFAAKDMITKEFGAEYSLPSPRFYKAKGRAQEAHEAIRPSDVTITPSSVKFSLTKDQFKLYDLIWKRMVACQMKEAIFNQIEAKINGEKGGSVLPYTFTAKGQSVKFAGFLMAYTEGSDDPEEEIEKQEKLLPVMEKDEVVKAKEFVPSQNFTKPPARYTEASLVKKLESEGIGRPSTYAPTISTILMREYVKKNEKTLMPTDLGNVVTDLLVENFPVVVDYKFTAEMEETLDDVADGKREWQPVIKDFYGPFHKLIVEKQKTLQKKDIVNEATSEVCTKCGKPMVIKLGRFGKFLSCSDYPKCKNARPLENGKESAELKETEKKLAGKKCDKCGAEMLVKQGRFGTFLGCSAYPKCKNIQSIVKFMDVKCPKCGGQVIERHTKRGKVFYGCNKYPKCKFATWDKPTGEMCKSCDSPIIEKEGKDGVKKICSECKLEVV